MFQKILSVDPVLLRYVILGTKLGPKWFISPEQQFFSEPFFSFYLPVLKKIFITDPKIWAYHFWALNGTIGPREFFLEKPLM